MQRFQVLLPLATLTALRAESDRTGASVAEIIRRVLAGWAVSK